VQDERVWEENASHYPGVALAGGATYDDMKLRSIRLCICIPSIDLSMEESLTLGNDEDCFAFERGNRRRTHLTKVGLVIYADRRSTQTP
jgi:hypothetical protein